jgi:hypothetical protein
MITLVERILDISTQAHDLRVPDVHIEVTRDDAWDAVPVILSLSQ